MCLGLPSIGGVGDEIYEYTSASSSHAGTSASIRPHTHEPLPGNHQIAHAMLRIVISMIPDLLHLKFGTLLTGHDGVADGLMSVKALRGAGRDMSTDLVETGVRFGEAKCGKKLPKAGEAGWRGVPKEACWLVKRE
ncbi:hypothetical protein FOPE_05630 [Fonsecaea pedrosoi]|nr:hypothetical protein FOPE_05630 [Fonsecaea pedrosoi]